MLKLVGKGIRTVSVRLRTQGARTTALWAYARGIPKVTGVPLLEYSRVTESLYVGPQHRANGSRTLLRAGITHIVNMRIEFDDASNGLTLGDEPQFGYCYLPTTDDEAISPSHITQGIGFISKAIESGERSISTALLVLDARQRWRQHISSARDTAQKRPWTSFAGRALSLDRRQSNYKD